MARRYTTRDEDARYILSRIALAMRTWQVGEACASFTNGRPGIDVPYTTVARIDGDTVYLADGTSGHRSKMRPAALKLEGLCDGSTGRTR